MKKKIYKIFPLLLAGLILALTSNADSLINNGLAEEATPNTVVWTNGWSDNVAEPENYAYSFALIGDTQTLTHNYPAKFHYIYDYLVENVEKTKLKHVFGLGDITDLNADYEWSLAQYQIGKLDGVVSYSLVRGNHDEHAKFEKYFGGNLSPYAKQYKEMYEENSTTTVHEFSAGQLDYLVITLDFCPSDAMLAWASEVIERHPNHNVIISTHSYLDDEGVLDEEIDGSIPISKPGENNGTEVWEKLVSKHQNIVMVYCGHVCNSQEKVLLTQSTADNGNVVSQLMVNPQNTELLDPMGLVAMLYFSEDGSQVDVRYYSTIKKQWFMEENQFSFTVATVARANEK